MTLPIPPDPGTLHLHGRVLHHIHAYGVIIGIGLLGIMASGHVYIDQPQTFEPYQITAPSPSVLPLQRLPIHTRYDCESTSATSEVCWPADPYELD